MVRSNSQPLKVTNFMAQDDKFSVHLKRESNRIEELKHSIEEIKIESENNIPHLLVLSMQSKPQN